MPKRFKDRIDFLPSLMSAGRERLNDTDQPLNSTRDIDIMALAYVSGPGSTSPFINIGIVNRTDSNMARNYLKDFKYAVHSLNLKVNFTEQFVRLNAKDIFSTLYEIQRQVYKLDSEVGEVEIKMLNGFSKVHLNTFVRQMDSQLQYKDRSWITDFKTSFSYPEKYLMHLLPSSGITLPRKYESKVPIIDAYIVDEATDVGDTLTPVISTSPRNVFQKNKLFKHILIRKGFDETSRKYKSKTLHDTYPYSATSQLCLELVLPNICMINYLKVDPVNASSFSIKSIDYLSESGEQVSILSQKIDGDLFATYLFEPIHTKYLRVTFEQASTVAKTTSVIGDLESLALSDILEGAGFSAEINADTEQVSGKWYDFSIKSVEVGEIGYENKGIYRSQSTKVASPIGCEVTRYVEAITPEQLFSEYYKTIVLPEGKSLVEAYVGVRLFNKEGGSEVDAIVPVPDSYPTQIEFLDFLHTDARVKLFPDLEWHLNDNCVKDVSLEEVCISLDEVVPEIYVEETQPEVEEDENQDSNSNPYDDVIDSFENNDVPYDTDNDSGLNEDGEDEGTSSCLLRGERLVVDYRWKTKAIENFAIGDVVYTYDFRRKAYGEYVVTACMDGLSAGWLEIYFDGIDNPIKCSLSHHMLDEDFNQTPAYLIDEGDSVWLIQENDVLDIVEVSEIIYHDEEVEVYNIEVEDAHTYITSNGILQHNKVVEDPGGGFIGPDIDLDPPVMEDPPETETAFLRKDVADDTSWIRQYTTPRNRDLPTVNRVGKLKVDDDLLGYALGSAYSRLSDTQKQSVINNASLSNELMSLQKRLMIGSDGVLPGYTKVSPIHLEGKDLNLIGRAYWRDRLVEVKPVLTSSTKSQQKYEVQLSAPAKNLSQKALANLSPKDRVEVKRIARVQELAERVRTVVPSRSSGAKAVIGSLKDSKKLEIINEFIDSVFSPNIGYKVNDRGAIEIALTSGNKDEDKLYSSEYAARKNNKSFVIKNKSRTWGSFYVDSFSAVDTSLLDTGAIDTSPGGGGATIDPGYAPVTDALKQISDCVDFISFTTESPHGFKDGDIASLDSDDTRFSGLYIVSYVEDDYTFYISLDSFTGLMNTFGLSFQDTYGEEYLAITSETTASTKELIDVSSIVNETASFPYLALAEQIALSLESASDEGFGYEKIEYVDTVNWTVFDIHMAPNGTDGSIEPSLIVGSMIDNGIVSFSDWAFNGTSWVSTCTINSLENIYAVDFQLTQGELDDLKLARICLYNQDVESPIELYEDERLLKIGVDYSVSLDDKSTWYDYWLMPGEFSYKYLNKKAKAGRFYVRVHNRNPHAIYWIKYRIKRNQALSACEQVRMKNGRVVFNRKLKETFGTFQTVFIVRTNSTNPYITPILREYSLRVQERDQSLVTKSNLSNKEVLSRNTRFKRNVS